jgi:hypothetical protein
MKKIIGWTLLILLLAGVLLYGAIQVVNQSAGLSQMATDRYYEHLPTQWANDRMRTQVAR